MKRIVEKFKTCSSLQKGLNKRAKTSYIEALFRHKNEVWVTWATYDNPGKYTTYLKYHCLRYKEPKALQEFLRTTKFQFWKHVSMPSTVWAIFHECCYREETR